MGFFKKIKTKFLDFDHPPKPIVLVCFDTFLVLFILIVYVLARHMIPGIGIFYTGAIVVPEASPSAVSSAETPVPSEEVDLAPLTIAEKFADKFSSEVQVGENYYRSPNISVDITEHESGDDASPHQHWFVADIYVTDVRYFRTLMHDGSNNQVGQSIRAMSDDSNAVVSINGDYAWTTSSGVIIRNGEVYRDVPSEAQICVLFTDGTMECYSAQDYNSEEVLSRGVWQAWTFGPSLLGNRGIALTDFPSYYGSVLDTNPRTVVGYYEPGHYCFVVVDGRQPGYSSGFDMQTTASIMEALGCKVAYNLDGGRSSQMVFQSEYVNRPYNNGRFVGDILYITDSLEEGAASNADNN